MTDLLGIAAIIAAVSAALTSFETGRRAARRDAAAVAERAADREEAKAERAEAAAKLDDIGHKVDGAQSALIAKVDSLRSDNTTLKTEVTRLNVPGAASSNENEGPVSTDAAGVNVTGEDRRR